MKSKIDENEKVKIQKTHFKAIIYLKLKAEYLNLKVWIKNMLYICLLISIIKCLIMKCKNVLKETKSHFLFVHDQVIIFCELK